MLGEMLRRSELLIRVREVGAITRVGVCSANLDWQFALDG